MRSNRAHVARALGEDPAHSLSLPLPHICALPALALTQLHPPPPLLLRRSAIAAGRLDICQRFGHSELRLSLAHREPAAVYPFLNSSSRFALNLSPA
jgi:hypothetical protein